MTDAQGLEALDTIREPLCRTLAAGDLPIERVLSACDALSERLNETEHLPALLSLGMTEREARDELSLAKAMLRREYLEARLRSEFNEIPGNENGLVPFDREKQVTQVWKPLGVLLHIAAGNADALPAFSVIEGLLTGNVNILKLPGSDDDLSTKLLHELIEIEPLIADYVYVFDFPSEDTESMKKMACMANAIVVWGGDVAVSAVRQMAQPDTMIIEWGHKVSFAYVSGEDVSDRALEGIAYNICETEQLLCSSYQGIYLDTDDMDEVFGFAERFVSILDGVVLSKAGEASVSLRGQKTLELYTEKLESIFADKRVYQTTRCSVIAYSDSRLESSYMFRNCWIKPLPKKRLLSTLFTYKNHLQTVALVCPEPRRAELESLLLATGAVRLTDGWNMSKNYCGMPHDGEYALRRYMKRVSIEYTDRQ